MWLKLAKILAKMRLTLQFFLAVFLKGVFKTLSQAGTARQADVTYHV
jgi:hypothetical protein